MDGLKKKRKDGSRKERKLKEELEKKKAESEEYLTNLKYIKADFENYKKRVAREKEECSKYATERLIYDLLEAVDNLERAIGAGKSEEGSKENLLEGVELIYKQLMKILEQEGVKCIKSKGEIFDPYIHECVMTENMKDLEEDTVIEELLKGYKMNEKVIRHSKVKISKR